MYRGSSTRLARSEILSRDDHLKVLAATAIYALICADDNLMYLLASLSA